MTTNQFDLGISNPSINTLRIDSVRDLEITEHYQTSPILDGVCRDNWNLTFGGELEIAVSPKERDFFPSPQRGRG
jgi:hypothetical protein